MTDQYCVLQGTGIFFSVILCHKWIKRHLDIKKHIPELIYQKNYTTENRIKKCPSLTNYNPSPLYYFDNHGQLQTGLQFFIRNVGRIFFSKINYSRQVLKLDDGATIGLDWVLNDISNQISDISPIVIINLGLCGDSNSEYAIHLVETLRDKQYRVVVIVARGCGGLLLTTDTGFNGSRTEDLHQAINYIHKKYPDAKLFGIGFSLGAGIMLKYLGVESRNLLEAAVCISPPWNYFKQTSVFSWWSVLLVSALKYYYFQHVSVFKRRGLNPWKVLSISNLRQWDETNAGIYGFDSIDDYYTAGSSYSVAKNIITPTIGISAYDDPVCCVQGCPSDPKDIGEGLVIVKTRYGGHLGFAEGLLPLRSSWVDRVILEWFTVIQDEEL